MLVFSTHAFTEGDTVEYLNGFLMDFSTHAFTEGDQHFRSMFRLMRISQLTPSRKATVAYPFDSKENIFSTHAFTEGDCKFK